jgi:hypothetical protein
MQQIMSRLNTGPQHGMLRHQPAAARFRRTTPNRNQIGSTHKALPRSRCASESARAAERSRTDQTDSSHNANASLPDWEETEGRKDFLNRRSQRTQRIKISNVPLPIVHSLCFDVPAIVKINPVMQLF